MTAQKRREGDGLPPPEDLGRVTSFPLVEVRTVLSRARTALLDLEAPFTTASATSRELVGPRWMVTSWVREFGPQGRQTGITPPTFAPHPQGDEMVAAMRKVVELLEPWERTGR